MGNSRCHVKLECSEGSGKWREGAMMDYRWLLTSTKESPQWQFWEPEARVVKGPSMSIIGSLEGERILSKGKVTLFLGEGGEA